MCLSAPTSVLGQMGDQTDRDKTRWCLQGGNWRSRHSVLHVSTGWTLRGRRATAVHKVGLGQCSALRATAALRQPIGQSIDPRYVDYPLASRESDECVLVAT